MSGRRLQKLQANEQSTRLDAIVSIRITRAPRLHRRPRQIPRSQAAQASVRRRIISRISSSTNQPGGHGRRCNRKCQRLPPISQEMFWNRQWTGAAHVQSSESIGALRRAKRWTLARERPCWARHCATTACPEILRGARLLRVQCRGHNKRRHFLPTSRVVGFSPVLAARPCGIFTKPQRLSRHFPTAPRVVFPKAGGPPV